MSDNVPTLGVVAISYNEEVDLPGFLANLDPWVDEIVIIDDGSSDRTAEIAVQASPKLNFIVSRRKDGEFYADQRNKGIDAAKSDWLLHLDIDERVPKALAEEILAAIRSNQYDAYRYRRLNYFLHRPMRAGGWADWNLVHLAKREVFRFGGMFHESIHLSINDDRVGQLREKMHHLNDDSYSERLRKSMNYQKEVISHLKKKEVKVSYTKLLMAVLKEFAYKYFYKRGFSDGTAGLISAIHSSYAIFRAYALLWDEQNRIERASIEGKFQNQWEVKSIN